MKELALGLGYRITLFKETPISILWVRGERKMMKRFSEEAKLKALMWSNRHCCICDKSCGLDIEIAHIAPDGGESFANAIPVCYTHHAQIGRHIYSKEHPRGNKYRILELRKRREQIYEKYTRHLIPSLLWYLVPRFGMGLPKVMGDPRLPTVGFVRENRSIHLPAKFQTMVRAFLGGEEIKVKINPRKPYYGKGIVWNLNSGHTFSGEFSLEDKCVTSDDHLLVEVKVTVIDAYE